MNQDDFRYMRRGKQLSSLNEEDFNFIKPIDQRGTKKNCALLILHGFSSSPAVYRYLIPQIKGYDAIVCPVLPGHGDSIDAFSNSTSAEWLDAVSKICDELTKEYKKVDVLGLSLGGLLACELSNRFSIHHLYLLAPAVRIKMHVNFMLKLAQILNCLGFRHLRNMAGNIKANDRAEIAYRKLPIAAIIQMLSLAQHYQWKPPTCPTTLFLGTYDEVVDSEQVEELFRNLPNVSIHWLKNSAHVLPLDNDLQEIVERINSKD